MDSITLQIVLQLPTIALLVFAGILFRGIQREKANLEETRMLLEAKLAELQSSDTERTVKRFESKLKVLATEIETILKSMGETSQENERVREYVTNQKTALKEFGRVLSRTSEQTYGDLQQLDDKITSIRKALSDQGFELPAVAA